MRIVQLSAGLLMCLLLILGVSGCTDSGLGLGPGEVVDLTGRWTLSFEKRSRPNLGCYGRGIVLLITQQPGTRGGMLSGVTEGGDAGCPGGTRRSNLSAGTLRGEVLRIEPFEGRARVLIEIAITIPGELHVELPIVTAEPAPFDSQGEVSELLGQYVGIVGFTLARR